jgi:hypothetical protein
LVELAEPAALGALAAPHLLYLIAAKRKDQLVRVLRDVTRQRHGKVEVQAQLRLALPLLRPAQREDLPLDAALGQEHVHAFDRRRFDGRESEELVLLSNNRHQPLFDEPLVRQPFGKAGNRLDFDAHAAVQSFRGVS